MTLDIQSFSQNFVYTAHAPATKLQLELGEMAQLDTLAEQKKKRLGWLLAGFILGGVVTFLLAASIEPVFSTVIGALAVLIIAGCIAGAIATGVRFNYWRKLDFPDWRYQLPDQLIEMLSRDMDRSVPIALRLDMTKATDRTKKIATFPDPYRSGWKIDQFSDPWLQLSGVFLDGTEFSLGLTERNVAKYGWKRSRSGKRKFKRKMKPKGLEVTLTLEIPRKKYGAITLLKQEVADAIHLPPNTPIKHIKVTDNHFSLMAKVPPHKTTNVHNIDQLYQIVTLLFLSAYQVLNLAHKLSKSVES